MYTYEFPTKLIVCVAQNFHGHDWILYWEEDTTSEDVHIIRWHCGILTFWNQFAGSVGQNRPVAFLMVGITTMTMTKMTMAMMMMIHSFGHPHGRHGHYPAESVLLSRWKPDWITPRHPTCRRLKCHQQIYININRQIQTQTRIQTQTQT